MVAAGINPMLAVSQGGASTPTAQAPHVEREEQWSQVAGSVAKNPQALLALQQAAANVKLTLANAFKTEKEGNRLAFENNPDIIGPDWDRKVEMVKAQIDEAISRKELNDAERKKIEEMLPVAIELEKARRVLTQEQSTSAAQTRRLEGLTEAELRTTQKWFEEMGASGRVMDFINRAIMLLGR